MNSELAERGQPVLQIVYAPVNTRTLLTKQSPFINKTGLQRVRNPDTPQHYKNINLQSVKASGLGVWTLDQTTSTNKLQGDGLTCPSILLQSPCFTPPLSPDGFLGAVLTFQNMGECFPDLSSSIPPCLQIYTSKLPYGSFPAQSQGCGGKISYACSCIHHPYWSTPTRDTHVF